MKNNSAHVATAFRGNLTDKNRSDLKKQEDAHSLNIHCTERWLYNITLWLEALYVSCFVTNMAGILDGSKFTQRLRVFYFIFQGIIKFFPPLFQQLEVLSRGLPICTKTFAEYSYQAGITVHYERMAKSFSSSPLIKTRDDFSGNTIHALTSFTNVKIRSVTTSYYYYAVNFCCV